MSSETAADPDEERRVVEMLRGARTQIIAELRNVIIGQQDVIEQLLLAMFSGGHCLITGAPGLAKTPRISYQETISGA